MGKSIEDELGTVRYLLKGTRGRVDLPIYDGPITAGECIIQSMLGDKNPPYMPNYRFLKTMTPRINPDNEARGFITDGGQPLFHPEGFPDMFGITWVFIPQVGGAMVKPGAPTLEDMNDWEDVVKWPDPEKWDWEYQKEVSKDHVNEKELALSPTIVNGYFERMISFMDFEGAALALIDDDQKDAVHAFLDRLADLYIQIIDLYCKHFPQIQGFTIHDDWGSQRAPFFSLNTAMEMLVPHMKKVADHIHSKGLFYDMHCCGQVEALIPAMIEIGVDCWSGQPMNDKIKLYDLYGDKILIGVETPSIPADMPDEEVAKIAKEFVDRLMVPGKPAMVSYNSDIHRPEFFKYVYEYSREKFG